MRRLALLASASPWTEASFHAAAKDLYYFGKNRRTPALGDSPFLHEWRATRDWYLDYLARPEIQNNLKDVARISETRMRGATCHQSCCPFVGFGENAWTPRTATAEGNHHGNSG